MGIYSTMKLNRSQAIQMVLAKQPVDWTNKELEDLLFDLYSEKTFNNYTVVDDEEEIEDPYDF